MSDLDSIWTPESFWTPVWTPPNGPQLTAYPDLRLLLRAVESAFSGTLTNMETTLIFYIRKATATPGGKIVPSLELRRIDVWAGATIVWRFTHMSRRLRRPWRAPIRRVKGYCAPSGRQMGYAFRSAKLRLNLYF